LFMLHEGFFLQVLFVQEWLVRRLFVHGLFAQELFTQRLFVQKYSCLDNMRGAIHARQMSLCICTTWDSSGRGLFVLGLFVTVVFFLG
jgi:hypothetical protein